MSDGRGLIEWALHVVEKENQIGRKLFWFSAIFFVVNVKWTGLN